MPDDTPTPDATQSTPRRRLSPHDEQNKAGRLMDLVAPRPPSPAPVATLAEAWRAVPPDERLRFLAGEYTEDECLALASALVAHVQQKAPHA
jgi:hypothetical protein